MGNQIFIMITEMLLGVSGLQLNIVKYLKQDWSTELALIRLDRLS